MTFDPNAAADHDTLFGLPPTDRPAVSILPVPFDATTSFRPGTASCAPFVVEASQQVDLFHPDVPDAWEQGIAMDPAPAGLAERNTATRALVERCRAGEDLHAEVDAAGDAVEAAVHAFTAGVLDDGRIPGILGGDHSVPLGAFRAAAERHPGLGILHVDAHADLREAYEGFRHSHASIFHNALDLDVGTIVQVGIRDLCHAEHVLQRDEPRLQVLTDARIAEAVASGEPLARLFGRAVARLPDPVWLSIDIDGLDPAFCPNTGTPVPGGLSWRELGVLLKLVGTSGRRIIGFDLCEVGAAPWDANVGARVLFALSSWAIHTRRSRP
jgi:agmatinase